MKRKNLSKAIMLDEEFVNLEDMIEALIEIDQADEPRFSVSFDAEIPKKNGNGYQNVSYVFGFEDLPAKLIALLRERKNVLRNELQTMGIEFDE